jgi:hypothetical protein
MLKKKFVKEKSEGWIKLIIGSLSSQLDLSSEAHLEQYKSATNFQEQLT